MSSRLSQNPANARTAQPKCDHGAITPTKGRVELGRTRL